MAWPPAAYPLDEDITGATTIASRPHGAQHDEANTSINEIVAYLVGLPWDAGLAAHLAPINDSSARRSTGSWRAVQQIARRTKIRNNGSSKVHV